MPDFTPADRSYAELMLGLDLERDFQEGDHYAVRWESAPGFGRSYHVWCARPSDPPRAGSDGKRVHVWLPPLSYWVGELLARGCRMRFGAFDRTEASGELHYYIDAEWEAEDTTILHADARASLEEAVARLHGRVTERSRVET